MERGHIFIDIDSVVRRYPISLDLGEQGFPRRRRAAKCGDTAIGFAGIGEQLALVIIDVEQPLATADYREADHLAFAVVENMCSLMQYEIV